MKTLAPHITTEKIKDGNVINSLEIEQDRDSLKKRETKKLIIDDKIKDFYEGNFCHYEDGTLKVAIEVYENKLRTMNLKEFNPNGTLKNKSSMITYNGEVLEASNTRNNRTSILNKRERIQPKDLDFSL
ncbi:MAG: hypothetical protein OIF36_01715 [Alphaproteobacteria bacterium]|nr:hypothetical protein [Alphaproteobacteria bacterium]